MKITKYIVKKFVDSLIDRPSDLIKVLDYLFRAEKSKATISSALKDENFYSNYVGVLKENPEVEQKGFDELVKNEGNFVKVLETIKYSDLSLGKKRELISLTKYLFKHISFSQSGEDLIVEYLFRTLEIKDPTYLDIGAYDPYDLNNTALFYMKGSKGVSIDPNPDAIERFNRERSEDINLNIGIADKPGELKYYKIDSATLNTFSEKAANDYTKHGHKIIETKMIEVDTYEHVVEKYLNNKGPDFLSLDVEGLDEEILRSIDFSKHAPKVICVETISYSKKVDGIKDEKLIKFIEEQGYMLYADTNLNSIFVLKSIINHE